MNRSSSPLFLRISVGLGLATAAATSVMRADSALPPLPALSRPASSPFGHHTPAGAKLSSADGSTTAADRAAGPAPADDAVLTSASDPGARPPIFAATDAFLETSSTPVFEQTTLHPRADDHGAELESADVMPTADGGHHSQSPTPRPSQHPHTSAPHTSSSHTSSSHTSRPHTSRPHTPHSPKAGRHTAGPLRGPAGPGSSHGGRHAAAHARHA